MNYGQGLDAFERLERTSQGVISVYALNRDYHDVVKGKLKKIATVVCERYKVGGESVRGYGAADGKAAGP